MPEVFGIILENYLMILYMPRFLYVNSERGYTAIVLRDKNISPFETIKNLLINLNKLKIQPVLLIDFPTHYNMNNSKTEVYDY